MSSRRVASHFKTTVTYLRDSDSQSCVVEDTTVYRRGSDIDVSKEYVAFAFTFTFKDQEVQKDIFNVIVSH